MRRTWMAIAFVLAALQAQVPQPPDAYSPTEINSLFGAPVAMEIARDGNRAMVDNTSAGRRSRTYYDLQKDKALSVDPGHAASACGARPFSGD